MAEQALQSPAQIRTAPESQLTIEVQNLHKVYQLGEIRVPALRGVSLEVRSRRVRCHYGRFRFG